MWKYQDRSDNTRLHTRFVIALLCTMAVSACGLGCGLINLKPVIVTLSPAEAHAVLATRNQALSADFSAAPIRIEAERAFSVTSRGETIEGDCSWIENKLLWTPLEDFDPGRQYELSLEGDIATLDGRETRQNICVPFYSVRRDGQTLLTGYEPGSGVSIDIGSESTVILRLEFSEPMDGTSVRDAFSLSPSASISFSWNEDKRVASITCDTALSPCRLYSWSLSSEARSIEGSPLIRSEKACFVTDMDTEPPWVSRVYPVIRSGTVWLEAAADMTGIDYGLSIAIEFSEDLDERAPYSGICVEPALSGSVERCSPALYVYTPNNAWPPGEHLTLIVPAGLRDKAGLGMPHDWSLMFTPVFPFLRVLRAESGSAEVLNPSADSGLLAVTVGEAPEGLLTLTLFFSSPFDAPLMIDAVRRSSLSVFFPTGLPRPSLKSASWYSQDAMTLCWEGLRRSDAGSTNYYALRLPGGRQGILASGGTYLEDDVTLLIEALP